MPAVQGGVPSAAGAFVTPIYKWGKPLAIDRRLIAVAATQFARAAALVGRTAASLRPARLDTVGRRTPLVCVFNRVGRASGCGATARAAAGGGGGIRCTSRQPGRAPPWCRLSRVTKGQGLDSFCDRCRTSDRRLVGVPYSVLRTTLMTHRRAVVINAPSHTLMKKCEQKLSSVESGC